MAQRAYFGATMAVLKPNILIFVGGSKSFGTYISKNYPGTSLGFIFFARAWHQWARKANVWPKRAKNVNFGPKFLFLFIGSTTIGNPTSGIQEDTSFMLKTLNDGVPSLHWCQVGHDTKWVRKAKIWSKMTKDVYFGPNLAILGLKIHFFEE